MGVVFVMTDELYVKLSVLVLAVAILAAPGSTRERWSMGGADPNRMKPGLLTARYTASG